MSSDSVNTMSNGAPSDTVQGSTSNGVSVPASDGTNTATSGKSAPAGGSAGAVPGGTHPKQAPGSAPAAKAAGGAQKSVKRGDRYAPRSTEKHAETALDGSAGHTDAQVAADRLALQSALTRLRLASGEVVLAQNDEVAARAKCDEAESVLRPAIEAAEWTARLTPKGRAFVRGCQGRDVVKTAERFTAGLPAGAFSVLPGQLQRIQAAYGPALAARDAYDQAKAVRIAKAKAYVEARTAVDAATLALTYAVKRAEATSRVADAAPPRPTVPKTGA